MYLISFQNFISFQFEMKMFLQRMQNDISTVVTKQTNTSYLHSLIAAMVGKINGAYVEDRPI